MKLITAIIQPFMLDRLMRALRRQPISGFTVSEVWGCGQALTDALGELQPRMKVEIALADGEVDELSALIVETVGTSQRGDGIILVSDLAAAIKIEAAKAGQVKPGSR